MITALAAALVISPSPANAAFWFLPWIIFGTGKVIAVKTVVINKGSTVLIAKQRAAIGSTAKLGLLSGKSVIFSGKGKVISVAAVGGLLIERGLKSSGSQFIDQEVVKEIAAARSIGLTEYKTKVCTQRSGEHYAVPIDTVKCLDGKDPALLAKPLKLNNLKVSTAK
ncbi:hypothetical protein [Nostoc sp. UHCC 0870]|uniref:hypothetical protein n=1 Tax=Nostoc sp. UHCC 0870 TaxID=2914041 RepID=UPI0030D779DC|nr:hypothetical protein L6494_09715 [Nostoc sp. UHCC 0870]